MKKLIFLPLLLLLFTTFGQNVKQNKSKSGNNNLRIRTINGVVKGTLEKSGVISFKGIPFAAPPVASLRWKEPQPVTNWEGVREADHFGPRAMQAPIFGDMGFRSNGMSEDCLYLNVWTPAVKNKKLLPVLVYFYGGGFVAGDGSEPRYDGESMSQKGIVTLTVNYRLGAFGFMSHPELTKESPHHSSGNYGLLDQAAALKWVHQNITAFGGDPKRVTIAGESAGSVSVSAQMASPLSKDMIAGAIGESGSLLGALSAIPLNNAEEIGVQFAKMLGANSLADLRSLDAQKILEASTKFGPFRFAMNIDGYFFPKSPYSIYESGEQAHVPLLVGWNSEEMNYRMILGSDKPTLENYIKSVQKLYNNNAVEVLKAYNASSEEDVEKVATDLAGDRFIAFSTWKWADLQNKTGKKPVYRYLFSRPRPPMTPEMGNATPGLAGGVQKDNGVKTPPARGAVHSAEIEYALGNLSTNKVYDWTPDDYKVSKIMEEYFANFIKNGNPNGAGLPQWPAVNDKNSVSVMHIDVTTRAEPEQQRNRYLLMDQLSKNK